MNALEKKPWMKVSRIVKVKYIFIIIHFLATIVFGGTDSSGDLRISADIVRFV